MEDLSVEELASNLSTYEDQLREVRKLIKGKKDDPGISEYLDMEKELQEVITLTEELLATAKESGSAQNGAGLSAPNHLAGVQSEGPDDLPHSHMFAVGTRVQAVWSEDGEWYNATIEALTPNGYYVAYDEWGNREEVDPDNVRPLEEEAADALRRAEKEAEATKMALKRKIEQAATSDFQARSLPAKLRIDPNDPEDVKAAKRKKIHAFKSKSRFEQLEFAQNKRQNAWQQFQTTKGKAKKVGFFSGRKKESIFKSPDDSPRPYVAASRSCVLVPGAARLVWRGAAAWRVWRAADDIGGSVPGRRVCDAHDVRRRRPPAAAHHHRQPRRWPRGRTRSTKCQHDGQ